MISKGTFEITATWEKPHSDVEGVTIGRATFEKTFVGPLTATSRVDFMAAMSADQKSGGYVAFERITGTLEGRTGTFVMQHSGVRSATGQELTLFVVPGLGTGELGTLTGTMKIDIVEGQHHYTLDYTL